MEIIESVMWVSLGFAPTILGLELAYREGVAGSIKKKEKDKRVLLLSGKAGAARYVIAGVPVPESKGVVA